MDTFNPNTEYQNAKTAEEYDAVRFSSLAGRVFNRLEKQIVVQAFAELARGARIVDVPCGTGRLAEALLGAGLKVHGIDISAQMLAVARRRVSGFGDAFSSEVRDVKSVQPTESPFDGALCARVLMHFPLDEQIEFLRGVKRLTRGPIVINHSYLSPYQKLRRGVKRLLRHQTPTRHPVNEQQLQELLRACGLEERRRVRLNRLLSEAIYITAWPKA